MYAAWPLLDTVIATVDEQRLLYRLKSIDREYSCRNSRNNQHYNADGCISTVIDNNRIELALLEVSSAFKFDEEGKITKDHVKAGYGMIAMLNDIAYN